MRVTLIATSANAGQPSPRKTALVVTALEPLSFTGPPARACRTEQAQRYS